MFRLTLKRARFFLIILLSSSSICGAKIELKVVLYPYLPYFSGEQRDSDYGRHIESKFESAYPDIDLVFLESIDSGRFYDLNYLRELSLKVDILEIDAAFLSALAEEGAIKELNSITFDSATFHPVSIDAVTFQSGLYGVPHYMCTMFMFSKRPEILEVDSSSDLRLFTANASQEVLYFGFHEPVTQTAVFQNYIYGRDPESAPTPRQRDAFSRFLNGLEVNLDTRTHSLSFSTESANEAFFAEPTLAFVGYSDRIKYFRAHANVHRHETDIFSRPLCLNEKGGVKMFSDVFVVPSHVHDSKLEAVEKFWNFMNRNETISNFLAVSDQPEKAAYPRAILPAKMDFWKDESLIKDQDLREMMRSLKDFELVAFVLSPDDIINLRQKERSIERVIKLPDDDGFRF